MKGILELSYSNVFNINECDFFINLTSLISSMYDDPITWHDFYYTINSDYDQVNFSSFDEKLGKFMEKKYGKDNGPQIVSELFDIDRSKYEIEISEIFLEQYDNLFFEIKVYERWTD